MEYRPDSEPNTDVQFISSHLPVFTPDEAVFPEGPCSLVAVAPKCGRIFVAAGTKIKVLVTQALLEGESGADGTVTCINVGAQVTHVAASCDGLTLLVLILHHQEPHALFYEIRSLVPGYGEQKPLVSVAVAGAGGQVHGVSWNPIDPGSVVVAVSPSSLTLLTLKDTLVDVKSENIDARALGWSPKGKQLTVGLGDGTLKLFKPDLTAVRAIQRPPMDEVGAVLSITWFTNTEFFIGYTSSAEEGAHVIMYVNAPKAKVPRFVAYEYICNYNQGPRTPMFYPVFFPEWSVLCLVSSRAVNVAVLGRPGEGGEGWCEYEIEEGCAAAVHNVSITQETFPLGLAVDFTSQKTFTAKDNKVTGPCPVLCTLSTGGEINLFHMINNKTGAEPLTKPLHPLPTTAIRTPLQYGGVASYSVGEVAHQPPPIQPPPTLPNTVPPFLLPPQPQQTPLAASLSSGLPKLDSFSFNPPPQASTTTQQASPMQNLSANLSANFKPPPITASLFPKTEPAATSFFNIQGSGEVTKPTLPSPAPAPAPALPTPVTTTTQQDFKFPSFPLASVVPSNSATVPDAKPNLPSAAKPTDILAQSVAPPLTSRPAVVVVAEMDETLLATIDAAKTSFERELNEHLAMGELPRKVGDSVAIGELRCSLGETGEWVSEMSSTTSELKGEVGQLHSEVLEGFILAEEADAKVTKNKNPRHRLMLQPQTLDPHTRKQMDEIRSLYQYLQSQLAEIDTRLHLDWAAYRNEQNKKKKKELPASETLYQALKKCHYARKVCEQRVDSLCDRIKDLHLHSLSGLAAPHTHQEEDDDVLASLEKSLRETSISLSPHASTFKMLSPGKQESLQKVLAQRNFIPVRKCSHLPRMNMTTLDDLSPSSPSPNTPFLQHKTHTLLDSFGPQTFSTPLRNTHTPTPVTPQASSAIQEGEAVAPLAPEAQYEDITPPQTPDNSAKQGAKPASPLRALSRLVSEVPTTVASDSKVPGTTTFTEGMTAFRGFNNNGGAAPSGLKTPVTVASVASGPLQMASGPLQVASGPLQVASGPLQVASGPLQGAFKPVTSAPLSKTTLAFPFTQFAPPDLSSQGSTGGQQCLGGSSNLFKPPNISSDNSGGDSSGVEASHKPEVKVSPFFKPPQPVSESYTHLKDKLDATSPSPPSQDKMAAPTQPTTVSHPGTTTTVINVPRAVGGPCLTSLSVEAESTSSSSSTDSDTASNITVIGDTASLSTAAAGVGDTAGTSSEAALPPPASAAQSNLFAPSSASFTFWDGANSSSSSMFGGAAASSSKTTVEAAQPGSSSSASATPSSVSLFATPATPGAGFFTAASTAASGSLFTVPTTTTTTTASSNLFGAKTSSSPIKSLLASDAITVTPTTLFGNTTTGSMFGGTKVSNTGTMFGTTATSGGSVFGTSTTSPSVSIFATTTATNKSIFGTETTGASIFGGGTTTTTTTTTAATLFAVPSTAGVSMLGTTTAALTTTTTTDATGVSIFGTSTTPTTPAETPTPGIFADKTAGSMFVTTTSANSGAMFGTGSTSSGSMFGTSTGSGSMFGSTTSTTGSIFGGSTQISATTPSIFASAADTTVAGLSTSTSTTTTSASTTICASSSPPVHTIGLFSSPPSGDSQGFTFTPGGVTASTPPPTTAASTLFSSQAPNTTTATPTPTPFSTSTSAFTSLPTSTSSSTSSASVFGQATPRLVFGGAATSPQTPQASIFGGGRQATPTFATPPPASTGGGIFGGSSGSSLFGNTASGSVFGQSSTGANTGASPFASVSTSKAESSPFGGTSVFGGGGGFFSGLGSKPSAESANKNVFGTGSLSTAGPQTSLFGGNNNNNSSSSSPFQGSVFGGSSTVGTPGTSSFTGTGTGGGGGPVANTGFAVTSPQSPAFGGSPTFGGGPSFGGSPSFGSPPVFGGGSTFASPLTQPTGGGGFSTFASSGSSTFGSIAGSSSPGPGVGFGNFANQSNTATFGGIAQQGNDQPAPGTFGGGGGGEGGGGGGGGGGGNFGSGSNFSSWR